MIPREGRARDQDRLAQRDNDEQSAALDLDLGYALSLGLVFWARRDHHGDVQGSIRTQVAEL